MNLLYILGQPGAGKSSLVAALTDGCMTAVATRPFAHTLWTRLPLFDEIELAAETEAALPAASVVCELGRRRDSFSGTDALSMSVQPKAVAFLQAGKYPCVLAEGDRLATNGFLLGARNAGYEVQVIYLSVSQAVAEHRRATRSALLGTKPQNAGWVAGRVSKARALAETWNAVILDADQPLPAVLSQLESVGNPVVTLLRSEV